MELDTLLEAPAAKLPADTRFLYLDLLARAVCNYLYLGANTPETEFPVRDDQYGYAEWTIPKLARPHTALKFVQLENLHQLAVDLIKRRVPGDFLEAGVWQGGVLVFLAGLLKAYDQNERLLWAADSFAGIPRSHDRPDPVDAWTDRWEAGLDLVQANIRRYGLLSDRIRFVEGYFDATLPNADVGALALLRVDADTYQSTSEVLLHLYPRLSPGGYLIIDDWHLEGCREAVLDYRRRHGITAPVEGVFVPGDEEPMEVFWRVH